MKRASITILAGILIILGPRFLFAEDEAAPADLAETEQEVVPEAEPGEIDRGQRQDTSAAESAPAVEANISGDAAPASTENATPEEKADPEKDQRRSGIARLLKRLTNAEGKPVPIGVLTPIDYTTQSYSDVAQETILSNLSRYGKFDVRLVPYSPAALTLEEFRKVVVTNGIDVAILAVLKPTNFDIFMYDRRNPYQIFAHSENLPEEVQYQVTKEVVEEYTKLIIRRVLYEYMQDKSFELPREETRPFLNAEIPRWIASGRSLNLINNELLSNYYTSVSIGGVLETGNSKAWASNLVGLQLGRRVMGNYFLEAAIDLFSLNSFGLWLKYQFYNKENPYRFSLGVGLASASNGKTLNWDQNYSQGLGGTYVVPTASFVFPIVEVHIKIESKVFLSVDGSKMMFSVMPGIYMMF